jgi:hypothetical protein
MSSFMHARNLHYNLEHGFVHNWLVAGPQAIPVDTSPFKGDDVNQQIARHFYEADSGITETPVERGPLTEGLFQVGDYQGMWSYVACREDHFVEQSGLCVSPHYLRSWAYTQLHCRAPQDVLLVLTTHGPADVWLNGQHVQRLKHFCSQLPGSISFKVSLNKGVNKILVRFEAMAMREYSYAVALQVCRPVDDDSSGGGEQHLTSPGIQVTIPTLIQDVPRRNQFERAAAVTYLTQDVYESEEHIRLHWPADLKQPSPAVVRLVTPTGQIYAEAAVEGTAGDQVFLQQPRRIPVGPYRVFMMPRISEYYEQNLRITHEISLWSLGRNKFSASPYGTYEDRRREALIGASQWTGLFAEIAKMALGQWTAVETANILKAAQNPNPSELLGILGMLYRFGEHPEFPVQLPDSLEDCILSYPYGHAGDPGTEEVDMSDRILSYAVEILAGQRYPERVFTSSSKTGQWHRENGERLASEWLHERGERGFSEWDSNASFAAYLISLSHLIDLAESEAVWEMAAVLMDKIFVTIAINSYQGVFGSTHGRTCASYVKGALLEPTSGIARLMWGLGIFNHHIAGPVSLACMEEYEFPSIISDIAVSLPEEIWSREHHAVSTSRVVNKVTYKSPDGMLCSAQDYYPGQRGGQEHIWQATLGPTATVFVTHPASTSESDARQPNYWAGNATLPRVAQWKDALIAVYELPRDDWMGFTHAYFPVYAFDESTLQRGWAFARKGDGYLAITAARGLRLIKSGHYALRELRSYGHSNIWVCHMGRAALDGDFSSFRKKILALDLEYADDAVRFHTLRGDTLSFGWQGPFLRNQEEQPLTGFEHYENPFVVSGYPSRQLEIQYGDSLLRLAFGGTAESPSAIPPPDMS